MPNYSPSYSIFLQYIYLMFDPSQRSSHLRPPVIEVYYLYSLQRQPPTLPTRHFHHLLKKCNENSLVKKINLVRYYAIVILYT